MKTKFDRNSVRTWDDPLSERPLMDILLDSSFVIALVKQRRDLERELIDAIPKKIKIKILDLVLLELEHLARKGPSVTWTSAKAGLELLVKRGYQVLEHKPGPVDVDASLLAFAVSARPPTAIATLDRGLREGSRALGVSVISLKKVHGLIVEGSLN